MTVSMRVMSAGDGYRYLLRSVAAGDGDRSLSTPLTRYYAEKGTPPGFWLGDGVAALAGGRIRAGAPVAEAQLQLLIGMGRDPVTAEPLGRAFPVYRMVAERVAERVADLGQARGAELRAAVAAIEAEETVRGTRRAVAGYDYTFSVPKSVSVLWAVADAGLQALIMQAHHAAVAQVVAFMEREVAATRVGATGPDGAVAHVDVTGLIATAFDHYDSRAGDPQLHTHVVVSNKIKTVLDGHWRSLAGRPMHAATVALSEHYNAVLADELTRTLGLGWEQRDRGRDRNPAWEITGVGEELIVEFSSRSREIESEKKRLIAEYVAVHGRQPSSEIVIKLRAQATLATRPEKEVRSLAELTTEWRARASRLLDLDAGRWAQLITGAPAQHALRADDVALDLIDDLGRGVVEVVGEKRSTWRRWNLMAEASRQTMGWRFATVRDREAVVGMIVEAAERGSLRLTPPELASSPAAFQRPDGSSVFRPKHTTLFSSEQLLAAEDRLLERAATMTGPTVRIETVDRITAQPDGDGEMLSQDQIGALIKIAVSGRVVDVLVGPAGAGKTTAMAALRRAWESEHGAGSVVGLAPSAAAAQVLADDLGIAAVNTAKWWHTHLTQGLTFGAGQLVIIDEASLAGTLSLDRITNHAAAAGAKVLLVGDYAQLQSVDAGGVFGLLVEDRGDVAELVEVHRFVHGWEKAASLALRHGHPEAIDTYRQHDRIHGGATAGMIDAAYRGWKADREAGLVTVLIAETREDVIQLNARARADLIIAGTIKPGREVTLGDGTAAGQGDLIITRRNDRRLRQRSGWVRNGDTWTITAVRDDGSITVRRTGVARGGTVLLPAGYVAEHVDLGYAVTAHRAQGITTDTAHVLVDPTTTRENLYVALTRGSRSNTAYVVLDRPDDSHAQRHPGDNPDVTARSVLYGVLQHIGAELSAHQTITAEQEVWGSIAQLAAEYETIAAAAQHDRWTTLIRTCGLSADQAQQVIDSDVFGALTAELRRAEANRHNLDRLLPRLVRARPLTDAEDPAAVLHLRVAGATARLARTGRNVGMPPRLIAGLVPEAVGPMEADMRQALEERRALIEARADAVIDAALTVREAWLVDLGTPPADPRRWRTWRQHARVVAAYRDRYKIATQSPLGAPAETMAQKIDAARAKIAHDTARTLASTDHFSPPASRVDRRGPEL
ncbi:MobF family relaxase [Microlunatus sp. GCM10028923]|uniref:MobF family relaxase n=1 Tax=Microlunatus sp. GCM10028923 TaxID=3273400 RepID=UPI0036147E86